MNLDTGAFQSLAEFGIALAGFTSIVIVFGRRDGEIHPADRFRIRMGLVPSLGAAFLALLPVGLELTGLSPSAVWRLSSCVLVFAIIAEWVPGERGFRNLPAEALTIISSRVANFLRAVRLLALATGLLNATGLLFAPQPGAYFFAVLCPLLGGAIGFARTVFVRPGTD